MSETSEEVQARLMTITRRGIDAAFGDDLNRDDYDVVVIVGDKKVGQICVTGSCCPGCTSSIVGFAATVVGVAEPNKVVVVAVEEEAEEPKPETIN